MCSDGLFHGAGDAMPFDTASHSTFQLYMATDFGCTPEDIKYYALKVLQRAFDHVVHAEVPLAGDWLAMSTLLVAAADIEGRKPSV